MKSNKLALFIFVFLILLIAGWFYWFQWRPAQIRSKCQIGWTGKEDVQKFSEGNSIVLDDLTTIGELADTIYLNCLNKHGLKD